MDNQNQKSSAQILKLFLRLLKVLAIQCSRRGLLLQGRRRQ
nr:MAG TPA: hypothetical protein [Caudoviricetes sp.]